MTIKHLFTIICLFIGFTGFSQAQLEVFGKNKIQYRTFEWRIIETEDFRVYYYDRAGRDLARFVAEQADRDLQVIHKEAGTLFNKQLNIFVYNTFGDYKQSNIDYKVAHQVSQFNPAGEINISGDKLVVYYSGNHDHLKEQMRKGMAKIYLEHLIFGSDFKSLMSNALQYDLPYWLTEGYVQYIVDEWTSADESKWRSFHEKQDIDTAKSQILFNKLIWEHPELAGKMFWKYISSNYHKEQTRNLLATIHSKTSLQKGTKEVLNTKLLPLFKSIINDNHERLLSNPVEIPERNLILSLAKQQPQDEVRSLKVSPRGADLAYIVWRDGEYEVFVQKTEARDKEESPSVILRGGNKNYTEVGDPDYPLIAWSNNGFKLGIVYEKNNRIRIRIYDAIKAEIQNYTIPASRFDRVTGFTFMEDDNQLLFSAIKRGQSDLFEMTLRGFRIKQLTDDEWDDRSPVYVSGGSRRGVVFLSNRTQPILNIKPLPNELPSGQFQAFFYSTTTESNDLLQLTKEKEGRVEQIIPYGPDHFAFLSDKSGIKNRYLVYFNRDQNNRDTAYTVPHTFHTNNIVSHNYNAASSGIAEVIDKEDTFLFYYDKIDYPEKDVPQTWQDQAAKNHVYVQKYGKDHFDKPFQIFDANFQSLKNLNHIIKAGSFYQNEFNTNIRTPNLSLEEAMEMTEAKEEDSDLDISSLPQFNQSFLVDESVVVDSNDKRIIYVDSTYLKIRPFNYLPHFKMFEIGVKFDYSNIFSRYQPYQFQSGQYRPPSLSGMLFLQLFDQLEDHRINGGIQLGSNLSDYTAFVEYEQFKRRLDWSVQLMRQENREAYSFLIDPSAPALTLPGKQKSTFLKGGMRYPFTATQSTVFEFGLRHDEMIVKADHPLGLLLPNVQDLYFVSRLEFIQDNTINPELNIWNGNRFKVFGDYFHKLYTDNDMYSLSDQSEAPELGGVLNLGFDFRYYHKLYRNAIAAVRFAGAHSLGDYKIMYQMGGVENQINSSASQSMPPSGTNYYAFQSLATNLRGYEPNSRNGNTYALMNLELRVPVISTFTNWHTQSSFLKHFQLVGFLDVGSAWEGLLPTEENLSRDYNFSWPKGLRDPVVNVYIPNSSDKGMAIGYGGGIRTQLLGYFFRADVARNLKRDWSFHLSIGTDF